MTIYADDQWKSGSGLAAAALTMVTCPSGPSRPTRLLRRVRHRDRADGSPGLPERQRPRAAPTPGWYDPRRPRPADPSAEHAQRQPAGPPWRAPTTATTTACRRRAARRRRHQLPRLLPAAAVPASGAEVRDGRLGDPATGGSFLQVASEEAHLDLLPAAKTVFDQRNDALAAASGQATGLPLVIVALLLAIVIGSSCTGRSGGWPGAPTGCSTSGWHSRRWCSRSAPCGCWPASWRAART